MELLKSEELCFNFWILQKVKVKLVFSLGPLNFQKIVLNNHIDVNMVQ